MPCATLLSGLPVPTSTLTIAGADLDAEELQDGTGFTRTATVINVINNATASIRKHGGFIFTLTGIDNGATITTAYFRPILEDSIGVNKSMNCTIIGEDVDATDDFVTDADLTTRIATSPTTATATWTYVNSDAASSNPRISSPDVGPILQEIVDRPGWASGGRAHLMLEATASGTDNMGLVAYDHATLAPADLVVTFTNPGGGGGAGSGGGGGGSGYINHWA